MAVTQMAGNRIARKLRIRAEQANISTERFHEYIGVASKPRNPGRMIWFHARDAAAILPLLRVIEQLYNQQHDLQFLVTTRRQEQVDELLSHLPENTVHQYLPIDIDQPIQSFLNHWSPDIAILSNGEFWPRMLTILNAQNRPVIAINTKMTDKYHQHWRWLPGLAKSVLKIIGLILVQDQQLAQKLERLGVKSQKIRVTGTMGNTKMLLQRDEALYSGLTSAIGHRPAWLSASTHRDEEDVILNTQRVAMRRNRRLMLILHTREANRGAVIAARHENQNLTFALQENGDTPDDTTDVYITDQQSCLATYLQLASVSFCGGTLSTGKTIDPFHPASMGSAIMYGPACGKYQQDYDRYHNAGAARLVQNGGELAQTLNQIIAPDVAATMAHAAWEISSEGGEVSGIIISEILQKLAEGTPTNATA